MQISAGDTWVYTPEPGYEVAWVFAQSGTLSVSGERLVRELAVFEEGSGALHFYAQTDCALLLGAAAKHPHDLVLGSHSVHTHADALAQGVQRIVQIGEGLNKARA